MTWVPDGLLLRQGSVFRMPYQFKSEGEKYRYFVILNANAQCDKVIILTTTTTQYRKLQELYDKEAESILVGVHPHEYPDAERFCVIDCRKCQAYDKNDLIRKMKERDAVFKSPLPDSIMEKIIANIARDKTLPPSIKILILNENGG